MPIALQALGMVSTVLPRHMERLLPFSWAQTAPLGFLVEQAVALLVWDRGSLEAAEREALQARDEARAQALASARAQGGRRAGWMKGGGLQGLEEETEEMEGELGQDADDDEEEESEDEEESEEEEESDDGQEAEERESRGARRRVRFQDSGGDGERGIPRGDSIAEPQDSGSDSSRSDGSVLTGSGRDLSVEFSSWFGFTTTAKPSVSPTPSSSKGAPQGAGGAAVGRSLKPSFHRAASWKLGPSVSFWKDREKGQARDKGAQDPSSRWLAPFAKGQAVGSRTQLQKAVRLAR